MDKDSPEFQAALHDHAKSLGVDPVTEPHLMASVQEALLAELPPDWEQGETDDGTLYYFNTTTGESIWEHPLDAHYRNLIQTKKKEMQEQDKEDDAKKKATSSSNDRKAHDNKNANISNVEVYSFDDISDDENAVQSFSATNRTSTSVGGVNEKTDKTARFGALFPQPAPSMSGVMTSSNKSINQQSTFGTKTPATAASESQKTTNVGFGRDRSWLLDADDDNIPTPIRPNTADTSTAAPPTSSLSSFSPAKMSFSSLTASSGATATNYSLTSRLFGEPTSSSATKPALTLSSATVNANITAATIPSLDMKGDSLTSVVTSVSSTSPTAQSSKISPRRGIATTMKGSFLSEMANTNAGNENMQSPVISSTEDIAKLQQLEKKVSELTKKNDQITADLTKAKRDLEHKAQEANESNYWKMKHTELKTKLVDKDTELQQAAKGHAEAITKLQQQLEAVQAEKDWMAKNQTQLATSNTQELLEIKQSAAKVEAKLEAMQTQYKELEQTNQAIQSQDTQSKEMVGKVQATLEQERNEHKVEVAKLQEKLEREQSKHREEQDIAREQIESLKKELAVQGSRTAGLDGLQETVDKQKQTIQTLDEKIRALQSQIQASNDRETHVLDQLTQKKQECAELNHQIRSLTSELTVLMTELTTWQAKCKAEQEQRSELTTKSLDWQRQEQEFDRQRHNFEMQLREKSDQLLNLEQRLTKQQENEREMKGKLQTEIHQVTTELKAAKTLEKQCELLEREVEKLQDKLQMLDKELRVTKQELAASYNNVQQLHMEIDTWKRKEQQQKTLKDQLLHEKTHLEEHLTAAEAGVASFKHDKRLELDKLNFKIRDLESQLAQKEYECARLDEKFTKAEAWRLKESRRVEERDGQVLDLKEELAQLKSRNIDAENNVLIQELRRERDELAQQTKQLTQQLEEERTARQVNTQKCQDELQMMVKALEWQLPQLAAACVARTSDEWIQKCHQVVQALRDDFNMKALKERNELMAKIHQAEDHRDALEQKYKTAVAESEFLRKEVHRVEDNNKVLLDQLHTIRVYMTQRPMAFAHAWSHMNNHNGDNHINAPTGSSNTHFSSSSGQSPPPPPPSSAASSPDMPLMSDFSTINHLNTQLGILHEQFQQLFNATERKNPIYHKYYSPSDRFEIPSSPVGSSIGHKKGNVRPKHGEEERSTTFDLDTTMDVLLDETLENRKRSKVFETEKEQLLTTLETLGLPSTPSQWVPTFQSSSAIITPLSTPTTAVAEDEANTSLWYQRDYWRRKYQ